MKSSMNTGRLNQFAPFPDCLSSLNELLVISYCNGTRAHIHAYVAVGHLVSPGVRDEMFLSRGKQDS